MSEMLHVVKDIKPYQEYKYNNQSIYIYIYINIITYISIFRKSRGAGFQPSAEQDTFMSFQLENFPGVPDRFHAEGRDGLPMVKRSPCLTYD